MRDKKVKFGRYGVFTKVAGTKTLYKKKKDKKSSYLQLFKTKKGAVNNAANSRQSGLKASVHTTKKTKYKYAVLSSLKRR